MTLPKPNKARDTIDECLPYPSRARTEDDVPLSR